MDRLHLIYHELRRAESRYSYVVPCAEFAAQCALFRRLQEGQPAGYLRPEVTFDDGHLSCVEHALPLLREAGLQATFFITAGWTGQRVGYMGPDELRALRDAGMIVGAHGWSHQLLTACPPVDLERELRAPKERLEDILDVPVTTMSLPGGRVDKRVLEACRAAGYRQVFSSAPRPQVQGDTDLLTGRYNVRGNTSLSALDSLLQPATGVLRKLQRTDRVKSMAKVILGDRLYAGLWSLVNHEEPDAAEAEAGAG